MMKNSDFFGNNFHFMSPDVYALQYQMFGVGSGPIILDNVQCTGSETSLSNCSALSQPNCGHSKDAGVRCFSGMYYYC